MKYLFALLCLPVFLSFGCNNDDNGCGDDMKTLDQYIIDENLTVETATDPAYRYIITDPGGAVRPSQNANVTVNYVGTLTDGRIFDQTTGTPRTFNLQGLIPGWTLGIPRIGAGGKITLLLPPNLAYGNNSVGIICPNSELIFEIELVSFTE